MVVVFFVPVLIRAIRLLLQPLMVMLFVVAGHGRIIVQSLQRAVAIIGGFALVFRTARVFIHVLILVISIVLFVLGN